MRPRANVPPRGLPLPLSGPKKRAKLVLSLMVHEQEDPHLGAAAASAISVLDS
jgi:hypothetical protein